MLVDALLYGVILPAISAAVVLIVGIRLGWRWRAAPALAIGYVVGHWGLIGSPVLEASAIEEKLVLLALPAALLGVGEQLQRIPRLARWAVRFALATLVFSWLIGPTEGWAVVMMWALAMAVVWTAIANRVPERGPDERGALAAWWLLAAAGAGALTLGGTALIGQLQGTIAAALGAIFIATWLGSAIGGIAPVLAALLVGQYAAGAVYADLPGGAAIVLAGSPLLIAVAGLVRSERWLIKMAAPVGAAGVAVALALALTLASQPAATATGGEGAGEVAGEQDSDYGYEEY